MIILKEKNMKLNFGDYFTFENFKEFEANNKKIENEPNFPKRYAELYDRLFGSAILKFIKDYDKEYGFPSIENGEGHITHIQAALEKFLKGEELIGYEEREIPMLFYKAVSMNMGNFKREEVTENYLQNKYTAFVDQFNKGDFDGYELAEDCCKCYDCDQRLEMTIKNWKPTFNIREFTEGFKSRLIAPEPCIDKNILEVPIVFEKGELLISDWFRIPEFTETFNNDFSINSIKGRIESTQHHLEVGNVLHVVLGNCSPRIYKKGNTLVFGREDEDIDAPRNGFVEKGSVCTDLWATTIVEKTQLINIVAEKLFKDNNNQGNKDDYMVDANQKVEDYLSKNKFNITKISVKPGQYTLKFHGNYNQFSKKLENEEIPENMRTFFMLEQSGLQHTAKPKKMKM
jgi:hypothetical protein